MATLANNTRNVVVPPSASKTAARWDFLDATRGVAALLVVLHHCLDRFVRGYSGWAASHLILGQVGVFAFFTVSGFVIPMSLERSGTLQRFWGNRFYRLFPLFWCCLTCAGLAFYLHTALPEVPYGNLLRAYTANLTMIPQLFGSRNLLSVFWTLNLELVFYFLCTLLWLGGALRRSYLLLWFASIGFVLVNLGGVMILHRAISGDYMATLVTAFWGATLYRYFNGELVLRKVLIGTVPMAISITLSLWLRYELYPKPHEFPPGAYRGDTLSIACGWALFVGFFLLRKRHLPGILLWLGKVSYSTYLVHAVLIMFFPRSMNFWFGTPILVTATLAVSSLTFRYIETPFIGIRKRQL